MTWQEELRRLDAELAAGTISHDLHRRRREDILAEVSGNPVVSPFASPRAEVGGGAPQWQAANPAADAHQATQPPPQPPAPQQPPRVTPASLLSNGRPTTAPSPADTELTMPMSRLQAQPLIASPPPPENRGRRRTWLYISLGVFLALAAVIGGAWWLGGIGGPGGSAQGDTAPSSSPAPPAEVALEDRLPVLPGEQNTDNSTMSIAKGVELGLYPESSGKIFTDAGAKEIVYRASTDGDTAYFMLVIPLENAAAANTVVNDMRELMLGAGFSDETAQDTMSGELGERTLNGTWYASGDTAVNLWVSQPTADTSAERLSELASKAVADLRAALPLG
ncbi:hypothetical protein [Prauserella endophytica]|uniref:Flagellar basal body-associated protein FliL n=1 Tax=Prauserella endophytica TaxID=1592324 RepID=A0ABY2SC50_9PSEU|nr:hypothetical protein [Prauserella endophytica]TKG73405.1 hypothetical protein FCN18_02195 [Prauserella endophytica]